MNGEANPLVVVIIDREVVLKERGSKNVSISQCLILMSENSEHALSWKSELLTIKEVGLRLNAEVF